MFEWTAPFFGRFADRWSSLELGAIEGWLRPVATGGRVLDVGGGTGALAARMADQLSAVVTIVDPTAPMLAHVPDRPDLEPVIGRAERLPFADGSFDAVVSTDALHHVDHPERAAAEIVRVLRPGGRVAVFEIHRRGPVHALAWLERLLGEPGTFFTPDELAALFAAAGAPGTTEARRGPLFTFRGERPDVARG